MRRLKDDRMVQHDPTSYAHSEELTLGNVTFQAHDLGGHKAMRKVWKTYFPGVHGIIYLVDASEPSRIQESKEVQIIMIRNQMEFQNIKNLKKSQQLFWGIKQIKKGQCKKKNLENNQVY